MFSQDQIAKLANLKGEATAQQAIPYIAGMDLGDFEIAHAEVEGKFPYSVKRLRDFILHANDHLTTEYGQFLMALPGATPDKALTRLMHKAAPETIGRSFAEVRREVLSYRTEHLNRIVAYVESFL